MTDPISISVDFGGDQTSVEFSEEHVTITLDVSPLGPGLFRIESVPFMVESASVGDVIEAESRAGGHLRFIRVAERGGWRTYTFLLAAALIESESIAAIQDRVLSLGGHWECVFGGILLLCLPPTADYDPTGDVHTAGIGFGR